jgi:hypothetical protein
MQYVDRALDDPGQVGVALAVLVGAAVLWAVLVAALVTWTARRAGPGAARLALVCAGGAPALFAAAHIVVGDAGAREDYDLRGAYAAQAAVSMGSVLAALALAWAAYHRLGRTRLGAPLSPFKEFRFNDQLVWGLIVGLTIVFLPTLAGLRAAGANLLVFFGALYALRGLGVLAWFLAPGAVASALAVGAAMLLWPILLVAALGLGLGDTWADWRRRARPTT